MATGYKILHSIYNFLCFNYLCGFFYEIPLCIGSFRDSASTAASTVVHTCWVSGKYGHNLEKIMCRKGRECQIGFMTNVISGNLVLSLPL